MFSTPDSGWSAAGSTVLTRHWQRLRRWIPQRQSHLVTSADFSPDGSELAVRTYDDVLLWNRAEGTTAWSPFSQTPVEAPS